MQIGLAVSGADLRAVHLVQPVVGNHLARHIENQPAKGVTLIGVGLHAPVFTPQVFVHGGCHIHQTAPLTPQPPVAFTIDDIGAGGGIVTGFHQHPLDAVLNLLHRQLQPLGQQRQHRAGQDVRLRGAQLPGGRTSAFNGALDLARVKGHTAVIALVQPPWPALGLHIHSRLQNTSCSRKTKTKHNMERILPTEMAAIS